jgi:hypothetical protein
VYSYVHCMYQPEELRSAKALIHQSRPFGVPRADR